MTNPINNGDVTNIEQEVEAPSIENMMNERGRIIHSSSSKYIQNALNNLESILSRHGLALRRGTNSPLPGNYRPECDVTPVCETSNARLYASLIENLR